jgi:outer membrane biosynthesis protein TonB
MQASPDPIKARSAKDGGPGVLLSLLLHGLLLLAALWYVAHRPPLTDTQLRSFPVELVIGGTMGQAASTAPATRLQVARPHPESAPVPEGTSPNGTKEPEDELAARLRALAQLKTPDAALPNADNSAAPGGSGDGSGEGNYALKDFIRAQILRRWLPDMSLPGARNMPVLVRIRLLKSGVIDDVVIVNQERFVTDKIFRNMALSARDAALLASPIAWPPGRYDKTQTLTIDLDPKAVLR